MGGGGRTEDVISPDVAHVRVRRGRHYVEMMCRGLASAVMVVNRYKTTVRSKDVYKYSRESYVGERGRC
jgi:hypothetical protein